MPASRPDPVMPASVEARTHDLEGVGQIYENPGLAPELLGNPAAGYEPILLLTVNANETAAVRQVFLSGREPQYFRREQYLYEYLGRVGGRPIIGYRCAMGSAGPNAAMLRSLKAIAHHKPWVIIAVGIAFGRREQQQLADVLISEQVQPYESARVNENGSETRRGLPMPANRAWLDRCLQMNPAHLTVRKGLLLCGEKLSDNHEFREKLNQTWPLNIGGDMESEGLANACNDAKVDWLVVKGVSDWGDGSKAVGTEEEKDFCQLQAALNAAQVVYSALFLKAAPPIASETVRAMAREQSARNLQGSAQTAVQSSPQHARAQPAPAKRHAALGYEMRTPDLISLKMVMELHGSEQTMAQALQPSGAATNQTPTHDTLLQWLENADAPPVFALLGEYGMGKTISCQRLYRTLRDIGENASAASPAPAWARVPLYFDLRQLSLFKNLERQGTVQLPTAEALINDLINHGWVSTPGQPLPRFAEVQALLAQGALLIMDGLDECLVHLTDAQHPHFVSTILNLVADAGTAAPRRPRLLLSCRTNFFKTLDDQRNLFTGSHRGKMDAAWYQALVLLPLTDEQINRYLAAVLPGLDMERVQDLIAHTHNLGELAQRPMTLKLLAEHIPELEAMRKRGEPVNGAALYGMVTQKWLERDLGKHHLEPEHKMRLMPALAAHLWCSGVRSIEYAELHGWFHEWRASQPDLVRRYQGYNQNKLEEDLRTATFVVRQDENDKDGAGGIEGFRFAHSSLAEFFLARYLADAVEHDRFEDWAVPIPSSETLHFLAELLQLAHAHCQRKHAHMPEAAQRVHATLNRWRTQYRAQASELLLTYALAATKPGGKRAPDAPRPVLAGFDLRGAQLRGWEFGASAAQEYQASHAGVLRHADLRAAPAQPLLAMPSCQFGGADLCDARFTHVRLDGADFTGVKLDRAAFQHCSLRKTHWAQAALAGTVWRHCALEDSVWQPWGALYRTQAVACSGVDGLPQADAAMPPFWRLPQAGLAYPVAAGMGAAGAAGASTVQLAWLGGHRGSVHCVAFAPDGARMASAGDDQTVRLWDAATAECLACLVGHHGPVISVAFAPDGNTLASASQDGTIKLWHAGSGDCLATLAGHEDAVLSVAFAPDGTRLASASSDNSLRLWQVASGLCLAICIGHAGYVFSVVFAPDGASIASGAEDGSIKIWDASNGQCLQSLAGEGGSVRSVTFAPDGAQLAAASDNGNITLWDCARATRLATLIGHRNPVSSVAFAPDGKHLVSAGWDRTVKLWDTGSSLCLATLGGHNSVVTSAAFSPDGMRIASASWDGTVKLWEVASTACLASTAGNVAGMQTVVFSPDGTRIACAGADAAVWLWDAASAACLSSSQGHRMMVWSLAFAADGKCIASAAADRTVKLWDSPSATCQATLLGHGGGVYAVAFSPAGSLLASAADDNSVKLWHVASASCQHTLEGHDKSVWALAFAPDGGRLVSASADQRVKLWHVASGACLQTLSGHQGTVWAVAWAPDGKCIVSGADDATLKLWDAAQGTCLATLEGHHGAIFGVAFSPDGTCIVSASADHTIRLWHASSGACLATLHGHNGGVTSVAFAPDGQRIASISSDGTMRLWDTASGTCLRIYWADNAPDSPTRGHAVWRPAGSNGPHDPGELLDASGDAWRVLGWRVFDHPCAPGTWTRLPLLGY